MGLEMRGECERCRTNLTSGGMAYICVHECTFCHECANAMRHVCPNCSGELVRRPRPQPAHVSVQADA
jgi:hypothetical protein